MNGFVRSMAVVLLAMAPVAGTTSGVVAPGSPTDGEDEHGVVVLQDGGVLAGRVSREGDYYLVATHGGGNLRVAAANVMLVGRSLEDAYHKRRERLPRPTAEAHLALAEWCLRHTLVTQAGQEITEAARLEPGNPRVALLERRVELETRRLAKPTARVAGVERSEPPARWGLPPVDPSHPANRTPRKATMTSDLPPGAVERFTRRVQPVLVNNCTTAGCHQPGGGQEFQLDRALLHGLANRRSTMNNLAATLALVNRERPLESRLLVVPRQTHGGLQRPIFGPRQEPAFRHLVEWVALVSGEMDSQVATDLATEDAPQIAVVELTGTVGMLAPLSRSSAQLNPVFADEETTGAAGPVEVSDDEVDLALYEEDFAEFEPRAPIVRVGAQLEQWQPKDPFDPEVFNRRTADRRLPVRAAARAQQDQ